MRISTRARYGMRLMLELALQHGRNPVFLREIARKQEISEKYLGQIIMPLKSSGLVSSFRGAHGGYVLSRDPGQITLLDIVIALEGDLSLVECVTNPAACDRSPQCVTQEVWCKVGRAITSALQSMTLADLVQSSLEKQEQIISYTI